MLKIDMKSEETVRVEVIMTKELEKQLKEYLSVGKHFKSIHRKANLNDLIVGALSELVSSEEFKTKAKEKKAAKKAKTKTKTS